MILCCLLCSPRTSRIVQCHTYAVHPLKISARAPETQRPCHIQPILIFSPTHFVLIHVSTAICGVDLDQYVKRYLEVIFKIQKKSISVPCDFFQEIIQSQWLDKEIGFSCSRYQKSQSSYFAESRCQQRYPLRKNPRKKFFLAYFTCGRWTAFLGLWSHYSNLYFQ